MTTTDAPLADIGLRETLDTIVAGLLKNRHTFEDRWREVADYVDPTRPRFFASDKDAEDRKNSKIINSIATQALTVLQSGLLAGLASPARPWFELRLRRPGEPSKAVRVWLERCRDAMLSVFDRSNFYTSLGTLFRDEGAYATGVMGIFEDREDSVRFQVFPIGSYAIGSDTKGTIHSFCREFTMSLREAERTFGLENLSKGLQVAFRRHDFEVQIEVRHLIIPRKDVEDSSGGFFPIAEYYWEHSIGSGSNKRKPTWGSAAGGVSENKLLARKGYREFPIIAGRWSRNDDDVYGTNCPAFEAMGDIRMLQRMEKDYLNALAKLNDPPLVVDVALKNNPISQMPGEITWNETGNPDAVKVVEQVRTNLQHLSNEMIRVEQRILKAFHHDMFLMISGREGVQPLQNEQVFSLERERVTVLGPMTERTGDDVFEPTIDRTFAIMERASRAAWMRGEDGVLPMPPEEIAGEELEIEFTSEFAQAQKLARLSGIERHLNALAATAAMDPTVLDVSNLDHLMRQHADGLNLDPESSREEDEVNAIRSARQAQAEAAQMAEAAPGVAKAAKDLGEAVPQPDSVLESLASV